MSHIKTIEIKNFKSIRHQKIEDCRRVNVFIGYPNVGKSNILEALGLLSIDSSTNFTDFVRVKEPPTLFFDGDIENTLTVAVNNEYGVLGEYIDERLILSYQLSDNNGEFPGIKLNTVLNSSVIREIELKDFQHAGTRANFALTSHPEEFLIKKYEFKKHFEQSKNVYSSLKHPFGENIFSILYTNQFLKKDASDLLRVYDLEFLYDSREQEFTILKRTNTGIFTVPYDLIADTLQRLIFYKAAILSNKNSVLLFEEPEAHMFPPYIRKMTADIMFDKNDNQYFIATHSPYVLDELVEELEDELSVYLVDYKDGETKIIYLSREDLREVRDYGVDLFFNIESYLKNGQVHNA